jgi:phosphoribosylformimino-5-aminoimidazole carboxamide ribotide isomerase
MESESRGFQVMPCMDIRRADSALRIVQHNYTRTGGISRQPLDQALYFQDQGAEYLHIVDLDGVHSGEPRNDAIVRRLAGETGLRIEVGGGIRTLAHIEQYLAAGVWQVLLNTKALDLDFIRRCLNEFGRDSVSIALDVKGINVVSHGWSRMHDMSAMQLGQQLAELGVQRFVTTDVDRDASLRGPAVDKCLTLRSAVGGDWVVSGGISRPEHISHLVELGFSGAVIGRAFYDGTLSLEEVLKTARRSAPR